MIRKILTAAVAALLVLPGAAGAQQKLRVGKAVTSAFTFTPLDVGMEAGTFKNHGIEVEEFNFGGSAKLQQGLASKSIDIGIGSGPELAFVAKGAPVLGVAAMAGKPALLCIVVATPGPVKTVADLKGRTVSSSTTGSLTTWLVRELSRQQGWGPEGINVYIGSIPARWAALKTHDIDAIAADLGSGLQAERAGYGRILLHFGDLVKTFQIHAIFATNTVLQQKPEAVRGFLAGWFETVAFMRADKAKTVEIASKVTGLDPDIMARTYDEVISEFSADGKFDRAALDVLRRSFVELELLDHEPDMAPLFTEALLPAG
jgi:NitT/TauT family transport system substrate-binding protein